MRAPDNPWPQLPRVYKLDYGQEEAAAVFGADPRAYRITTKRLVGDQSGHVKEAHTVQIEWAKDESGRFVMREVPGTERIWPADLVLLAMGFLGPERVDASKRGLNVRWVRLRSSASRSPLGSLRHVRGRSLAHLSRSIAAGADTEFYAARTRQVLKIKPGVEVKTTLDDKGNVTGLTMVARDNKVNINCACPGGCKSDPGPGHGCVIEYVPGGGEASCSGDKNGGASPGSVDVEPESLPLRQSRQLAQPVDDPRARRPRGADDEERQPAGSLVRGDLPLEVGDIHAQRAAHSHTTQGRSAQAGRVSHLVEGIVASAET